MDGIGCGTLTTDSHQESSAFPNVESAAELLLDLSVFGFSQLSDNDQHEKTEEIHKKIAQCGVIEKLPYESEEDFRLRKFREMYKKLSFPEQHLFLSKLIKKLKREKEFGEVMYWFNQLNTNHQQEELGKLVHGTAEETNEDLRLGRFTQIARDYTNYVFRRVIGVTYKNGGLYCETRKDNDKISPEWLKVKSQFSEFFSGFSIIWFQGQCANDQWVLIEELRNELSIRLGNEVFERDLHIRLEIFTELCKKVVDFHTQVEFLDKAEKKLRQWTYLPHRLFLQLQDSSSAAELLSRLSSFGFSLLTLNDQLEKIEKCSEYYAVRSVIIERLEEESEEEFRMRRFTELYNKLYIQHRIKLFKELRVKFSKERCLCESIILFRKLGSNDQQEVMEELTGLLWGYKMEAIKGVTIKKFSEESEEDFKLRRFIRLCCVNPSLRDLFIRSEAEKWDIKGMLQTSVYDGIVHKIQQYSRYAEFFFGVSIIWFKTRCGNDPRNPIQLLLSGDIVEKLPNESEEDFRLRRFTESFKKLPFISQEYLVDYIEDTILKDIGPFEPLLGLSNVEPPDLPDWSDEPQKTIEEKNQLRLIICPADTEARGGPIGPSDPIPTRTRSRPAESLASKSLGPARKRSAQPGL